MRTCRKRGAGVLSEPQRDAVHCLLLRGVPNTSEQERLPLTIHPQQVCQQTACPPPSRCRRMPARARAGLDFGWAQPQPMTALPNDWWELRRSLAPGRYLYKFICDGVWGFDADHMLHDDGEHINNVVCVVPRGLSEKDQAAMARVLRPGGRLTGSEVATVRAHMGLA